MPEGQVVKEPKPAPRLTKEIQVGSGDPIRIRSFREVVYGRHSIESDVLKDLPEVSLDEAAEQIAALPFRLGSIKHIGTLPRYVYDADVVVERQTVAYDAPENERNKKNLVFRFGSDAGIGISLNTHNNLRVENGLRGDTTIIRFSLERALKIAGKEIGEVTLVIPMPHQKKKSSRESELIKG